MKLLLSLVALIAVCHAKVSSPRGVSCVNSQSDGTTYVGTDGGVYTIVCSADYYGGDLASEQQSTFADCINACDANSACIDVSYVPASQLCYLKSSVQSLVQNDGVWTARKVSANPSTPAPVTCDGNLGDGTFYTSGTVVFEIKCASDYYGGDLAIAQTATLELCMDACAANQQCVDVSYVVPSCYLKSSIGSIQSNTNVVTGLVVVGQSNTPPVTPPSPPNSPSCANDASDNTVYTTNSSKEYYIYCDTDYAGGDIASHQAASFADCIDFCDAAGDCTDVQYAAPWCYVKGQLGTASKKSGVWSAVAKVDVIAPVGQNSTSTSSTIVATSSSNAGSTCATVTATNTYNTTIYNPSTFLSVVVSTIVNTVNTTVYGTVTQTAPVSIALATIQNPGTTTVYSISTVYATVTATAYSTLYQKRSAFIQPQVTGCTVTITVNVTSTAISAAQTASTTLLSTSYASATTTQTFESDATVYTTPISTLSTTVFSVSTVVSVLVTYSTVTATLTSTVTSKTSTSSIQTCRATKPVLNSSFESHSGAQSDGWTPYNAVGSTGFNYVDSSVTAPHTGVISYAVTQPTYSTTVTDTFVQRVIFCPGLTYNWSAWFKILDTSTAITVTFGINRTGPRFTSTTGDWTLITGSFIATASNGYVFADMLIPVKSVTQNVYWDDIVITLAG